MAYVYKYAKKMYVEIKCIIICKIAMYKCLLQTLSPYDNNVKKSALHVIR